jgi:hypothetical protein
MTISAGNVKDAVRIRSDGVPAIAGGLKVRR